MRFNFFLMYDVFMEEKKTILFDPGYAPLVVESIGQVGYIYYMFCAVENLKIRKINFPVVVKKLEKNLKTNVAFYFGCLAWASYISQFKNCEIEGNKLLGEVCDEKEYTDEINFLIDFVKNKLPRDYKYYLNKNHPVDERYLPILETYREFLILNKGFVNCAKTDQIILPQGLKKPSEAELDEICKKIQKAIEEKNIDRLLDDFSLIF